MATRRRRPSPFANPRMGGKKKKGKGKKAAKGRRRPRTAQVPQERQPLPELAPAEPVEAPRGRRPRPPSGGRAGVAGSVGSRGRRVERAHGGAAGHRPGTSQLSRKAIEEALSDLEELRQADGLNTPLPKARPASSYATRRRQRPATAASGGGFDALRIDTSTTTLAGLSQGGEGHMKAVIKQLYVKNKKLTEQLRAKGEQVAVDEELLGQAERLAGEVQGDEEEDEDEDGGGRGGGKASHAHLLFMLEERNAQVAALQAECLRLREAVQALEAERKLDEAAQVATTKPPELVVKGEDASPLEYLEAHFQSATGEFLTVARSDAKVGPKALKVIGALERQLVHEAALRQMERSMLQAELYERERVEQANYVQLRLALQEAAELRQEIKAKDEVERNIEMQVYAILKRSQEVERENHLLRQNKGSDGGSDGAAAVKNV